jgi:hypothetical protein
MRKKSKIRLAVELLARVIFMTIVFTLMGFAIGLFCGIGAGLIYGALRHIPADMTMAYKFVAIPFGMMAALMAFLGMLYLEIKRLRRPAELTPASFGPRTS